MNRTKSKLIGVDPVTAGRFGPQFVPKPQRKYWHGRGTVEVALSGGALRVETIRAPIQSSGVLPLAALCAALTAEFQFVISLYDSARRPGM